MGIYDRLEAGFTTVDRQNSRLLESVLNGAVAS